MARIALVACTKRKTSTETTAEQLYISPLFRAARDYAVATSDTWYILSARHGLLRPDQKVSPYNETLKNMPREEKAAWAERVMVRLKEVLRPGDVVTFLAGLEYRSLLTDFIQQSHCDVKIPLQGLSIGRQVQWLQAAAHERTRPYWLNQFYKQVARLRVGLGDCPPLRGCDGRMPWPKRGVYFFFEPNEKREGSDEPRVVRVGTHGVSLGSTSTLWGRLRTHRGGADGSGNHRGSIFRLHVGAALIQKDNLQSLYPSWGRGQTASPEIRQAEVPLEKLVSEYIGQMNIAWLAIDDPPSASSDRRFVERNAIALLTSPMLVHDQPSACWLGRLSPHPFIRNSGMWNVQDVQESFDPRFFEVLTLYIDVTLGLRPPPRRSIAPSHTPRQKAKQQELFNEE